MPKSPYARSVDRIQAAIRLRLHEFGFRCRGRAFNRRTEDGLVQVLSIQMGQSDPPGTTYIPGLRENLHGLFAINLGIFVPEVALMQNGQQNKSWIQDHDCCVRARLGGLIGGEREIWWQARADECVVDDVLQAIDGAGLEFLERFSTRDHILREWQGRSENMGASSPPRIVCAIILATRGDRQRARMLLSQQALEARNPNHSAHVRSLAERLGLDPLDA